MDPNFKPIHISKKAILAIKKIIKNKNIPQKYGLRVGVRGTSCAGVSFLLGFDTKTINDIEFDIDGITLYVDKKHFMHLIGKKVDYQQNQKESGFIFIDERTAS